MPTKADQPAEHGADGERAGAAELEGAQVTLCREVEDDRDDENERPDLAELRSQVGVGAFADGGGDLLHALRALVCGLDLLGEHQGVQQTAHGDAKHHQQRDDFELAVPGVAEEREELEGVFPPGAGPASGAGVCPKSGRA